MRKLARTARLMLGVCSLALPLAAADGATADGAAGGDFAAVAKPLLAEYCYRCHGGAEPKADLALDGVQDLEAVLAERGVWRAVVDRLRDGEMPPEGERRPDAAELERVADWLDKQLASAGANRPRDPGRVTVRRLNRAEYNNTIRDLVGVDFRPADDFPSDDVGYGFDNIGDVLSLPPLLLEKYLAAARAIVEQAIVAHPRSRQIAHVEAAQAKGRSVGTAWRGSAWLFASNGELHIKFSVPAAGEYLLKTRTYGMQAGPEPARVSMRVDGKELRAEDIQAVEAKPKTVEAGAQLEAGEHQFAVAFINDWYEPENPDPANRDRNLIVEWLEVEGPRAAAAVELPAAHRRIISHEPAPDERRPAASQILRQFATRAYRRPATDSDVERLLKLFDVGYARDQNFAEGIRLAIQAVLVSPNFLFRVELDPEPTDPAGADVRSLSDFEIASRLSYFLWSSMPDEELFAAAAGGKLHEPVRLAAQARRMLTDAKASALVENFAGQWLQLRNLKTHTPDRAQFPEFDDSLRAAMLEESERFFAAVVNEDLSVLTFLDADFTFLNERLAKHYGIEGVAGNEFRRVRLSSEQRGGVLAQASMLTVTSNPTRTSPVKRGKWVLENLLATPPAPPPPGVPDLKDSAEAALEGSLRERLEQHRAKAECAVCHSRMDPIGFGLENYDAIGAWRDRDGNFAIDASGTLPGGKPFAGPAELRKALRSKQSQFLRCLAQKLLTYALGRGLEDYDRQTVADIVAAGAAADNQFSSLVVAVISSDAFLKRRTTGDMP